ncbi:MAG: hypothetical protein H7Z40_20395 [Phycisphaerae bacterium]|nr:hypothetical protein [Gemmatimonadaceae bacterium]
MQPRLALQFQLIPRSDSLDPEKALLSACASWLGLAHESLLNWDLPSNHTLDGGRILRWAPFVEDGTALADLVLHEPDPVDRAIQWSSHLTFVKTPSVSGISRRLNVRIGTTGGTPHSVTPPVRPPRLLSELDRDFLLVSNDGPLQKTPTQLEGSTLEAFVRYVLCDPARTMPVLLLTELPDGGYVIPPEAFGAEVFGLGASYVLRHADTFALSDAVGGHARSVFLGSARAYLPGFSLDSDPFQHPLVLARALALPGERRRLVQRLAEVSVERQIPDDVTVETLRDARAAMYGTGTYADEVEEEPETLDAVAGIEGDTTHLATMLKAYETSIRQVEGELSRTRERLIEMRAQLGYERTTVRALRTNLAAMREGQPVTRPVNDAPESVLEAVERAQALYPDALEVLPTALKSAEESLFPDAATAWRYMKTLGEVARKRRDRMLYKPLEEAFAEQDVEFVPGHYEPGVRRARDQYTFRAAEREVDCLDQLRRGENPATCLRVYFTSSEDGGFIVGHVGRQLDSVLVP